LGRSLPIRPINETGGASPAEIIPPTGPDFEIFAAKTPVVGTRFCGSAVGTGYNAEGKYYGNAAAGNCMGQFHVKDY
jgi:hypothetical protein